MSGSFVMKALRGVLVLVLLVAAWCAVLWWLIAPDFAALSLPELGAIHVGPPLLVWGGGRFWLHRRQQGKEAAAARQEQLAERERQATLENVRLAYAAEQQRLQFGCDCRALALVQLTNTSGKPELQMPENGAIHFSTLGPDETPVGDSLLDHLHPGVEEALDALYARCPGAAVFPIYVVPPPDVVGEEVVARVRAARSRFVANDSESFRFGSAMLESANAVYFLPQCESVADSVIGLFETNVELPGAVVLAFDSPWWREQHALDDSNDDTRDERHQQLGMPGQGVVAVLVTHPRLADMLVQTPRQGTIQDPMTPYWEKSGTRNTTSVYLSHLTDAGQDSLLRCEPLARIHRAAIATVTTLPAKRLVLSEAIETLIERAQILSGQVDLASSDVAEDTDATKVAVPKPVSASNCDWLVHNAGGYAFAGHRLASLGNALFRRKLDIDPIGAATNVIVSAGDLGQAGQVAMLATTVAQAANCAGSALCAEFGGNDLLSVFFAAASKG